MRTAELGIVLAQALTALWFYRLLHGLHTASAGAPAAFGIVNGQPMRCPEQPGAAGRTGQVVTS